MNNKYPAWLRLIALISVALFLFGIGDSIWNLYFSILIPISVTLFAIVAFLAKIYAERTQHGQEVGKETGM